jgi:hypothetical protein
MGGTNICLLQSCESNNGQYNAVLPVALLSHDMSHIGVTQISSIVRVDYTTHGLYPNSQGKKRLMHLIAEMVVGGLALGISSIHAITHDRVFPFLD